MTAWTEFAINSRHHIRPFTPADEARILASLRELGPTSAGLLARRLGEPQVVMSTWLGELQARGLVRPEATLQRPIWHPTPPIDETLATPELCRTVLEALLGRPSLPGALASALRADPEVISTACRVLARRGQLVATPVGNSTVYAHPTLVTRKGAA